MVYDHQKAIRCFRTVIDEMWNGFHLLNIKKNDLVEFCKSGFELIRINKSATEKKFYKV